MLRPLTVAEADSLVATPELIMLEHMPNKLREAFNASGKAALYGAGVGAGVSIAISAAEKNGKIDQSDILDAGKAAVAGGAISAAETATQILSDGYVPPGVASTVLLTSYRACKCLSNPKGERQKCVFEEVAVGGATGGAAILATAVCSPVIGPLGGVVCGMPAAQLTRSSLKKAFAKE